MSELAKRRADGGVPQMLGNIVNQQAGLPMLLASNMLAVHDTIARPEDFEPIMLVYAYDSFALIISFGEQSLGLSARAQPMDKAIVALLDGLAQD